MQIVRPNSCENTQGRWGRKGSQVLVLLAGAAWVQSKQGAACAQPARLDHGKGSLHSDRYKFRSPSNRRAW